MAPTILYIACVLGGLGLYLLVRGGGPERRGTGPIKALGALLGLAALAWLVVGASDALAGEEGGRPEAFFVIFSLIAVAAAVRLITHTKPVYSALYFVLVVLASAGLFLLLEAEFMAFALVIVYAGAILITYLFVLMLAQQSPDPRKPDEQAEYDMNPREPASGAIVGFILLALLSRMIFEGSGELEAPPVEEARVAAWRELARMPQRVEEYIAADVDGEFELVWDGERPRLEISADGSSAAAYYRVAEGDAPRRFPLPAAAMPENVQRVGLGLILRFPVSLELAGVILLMAMFGAVVLARRAMELGEDAKREAAQMRRLGHHDEPGEPAGGAGAS